MAAEEDAASGESSELEKLEKAIRTNRMFLIVLLVIAMLSVSILGTSVVVINGQMAGRKEVTSADFAEEMNQLADQLDHISTLHNAEAKVYFDFQDTLQAIADLYTDEKVNAYKTLLVEREKDQRDLMALMMASAESLAQMVPGNRRWVEDYRKKVADEVTASKAREKKIRDSMQAQPLIETKKEEEKPATKGGDK